MAPDLKPGEAPAGATLAVKAWNLMGGIEWGVLEFIVEFFGVEDIETFVRQLTAIRDDQNKRSE